MAYTEEMWRRGEKDPFFMPSDHVISEQATTPSPRPVGASSLEMDSTCPNCGGIAIWFYASTALGVTTITCKESCKGVK
jgi:hypothetical protein